MLIQIVGVMRVDVFESLVFTSLSQMQSVYACAESKGVKFCSLFGVREKEVVVCGSVITGLM